ncbi:CorA family divalent cation transporter [Pseudomonas sp. NA-150]|uniref:magnesium transporter CorA family protein n=1 Tax=Pseudomonas sp. NA-150 TaxID=3367525 RepID=UPI0037CA43C3
MIKSFQLAEGRLLPVASLNADVMLFMAPDVGERMRLHSHFDIDEHALASALDPDEVSRIEFRANNLFMIWKSPESYSGNNGFSFGVSSFGLVLCERRLLLISKDDSQLNDLGTHRPLQQPIDVLLDLLANSVHHYLGHLKVIKMVGRELQQRLNSSLENQHFIQMFNLSESLIYYINAIHGNGTVLARLRNHAQKLAFEPHTMDLIDDLIIENEQCYKQAEIYSTVFAGLMDARGNLVNNNMNALLRKLTVINVVFLPLNLIAGIGGMSEYSMMTATIPWWISYPAFCMAMVGVGGLMVQMLKRMAQRVA